ncbi:hypothetical protein K1719_019580 [Acacia pycnantha]|nr:hypothetical protein K1719_019580 [Acacia pycnantha]
MASSSSSTPSPQPRNKYDVFITFIGEDTLNCLNDKLSAHTSIFGLRLFVVLGICVGAAIVIVLFLISLWFTKRNNNSSNPNSSHNPSIPNVSKEIQQTKLDPSPDMASSSSSATSSQSRKKYDVFISFRGEDTRHNFTSHLYDALHSKDINTYIDYRLDKGDEVWPSLEKAIEDSTLFLVIFSENYASSTWCLKELAKILECSKNEGHLVMPVFYGVDPSHIRKQSGSYQEAFKQHKRRGIDKQQLQNWREALTHAANLSGWPCSDRNEAELIKDIIERVVQKLDDKYKSEDYLKDLIGIHRKMADVESLLYKGSNDDVRFIGIWGMGGVGKTTLANALFKKFHSAYEGSCFLSDVREKSKKSGIGIAALKKNLILGLLGDKQSNN